MRTAKLIAHLAIAIALGTLLVGRGLILPALDQSGGLIDANLAKSLAKPLHFRIAEVSVAAVLVLTSIAHRWLGRWATTMSLVALGTTAIHRWVLLPSLYGVWAKADLVARRPLAPLETAATLQTQELMLIATTVTLLLALTIADCRDATTSGPEHLEPTPAHPPPTPCSAPS